MRYFKINCKRMGYFNNVLVEAINEEEAMDVFENKLGRGQIIANFFDFEDWEMDELTEKDYEKMKKTEEKLPEYPKKIEETRLQRMVEAFRKFRERLSRTQKAFFGKFKKKTL